MLLDLFNFAMVHCTLARQYLIQRKNRLRRRMSSNPTLPTTTESWRFRSIFVLVTFLNLTIQNLKMCPFIFMSWLLGQSIWFVE